MQNDHRTLTLAIFLIYSKHNFYRNLLLFMQDNLIKTKTLLLHWATINTTIERRWYLTIPVDTITKTRHEIYISTSTYLNSRQNMNKENGWVQKSFQWNSKPYMSKLNQTYTHIIIMMNNMKGYFHSSKQLNQQQLKSCGYHNKYQFMWKMRIKRSFKGCNVA